MDGQQMEGRSTPFLERKGAVLEGYELTFNKVATKSSAMLNEGKANVVPKKDSAVHGILYKLDVALDFMDRKEVYPTHYDREEIDVLSYDNKRVKAWVYIARQDKTRANLKPTREYLDHLLAGQDILKSEHVARLKSVQTLD